MDKKQSVVIHLLNWIIHWNILVIKLLKFADIFIFLNPAPVVSVWKTDTLHNVIINMTTFASLYVDMCDHVWHHSAKQAVMLQNCI